MMLNDLSHPNQTEQFLIQNVATSLRDISDLEQSYRGFEHEIQPKFRKEQLQSPSMIDLDGHAWVQTATQPTGVNQNNARNAFKR